MRGELAGGIAGGPAARITPAYAGRTSSRSSRRRAGRDHPRVCGENLGPPFGTPPGAGSPPRMRGELRQIGDLHHGIRITPAYAGRTSDARSLHSDPGDHPRVCGENWCSLFRLSRESGSPPRMRGELFSALLLLPPERITPAYAGRTIAKSALLWAGPDHPRVCGENSFTAEDAMEQGGSPPRMRGEPQRSGRRVGGNRITPAYAGRTWPDPRRWHRDRDHPRVCGENRAVPFPEARASGSPPRMRGERGPVAPGVCRPRITPAYAGRTDSPQHQLVGVRDHPRVCGENQHHARHVAA
ncbi:Hypothetical protein PFR_JS2_1824 [Propionibacterium freudenreichii]|nr:Hypothetical protein PFR_JS2_1824 [Propionibacterium freudenreichii]